MFNNKTKVCVYGDQREAIQSALDYDFLCQKREPAIVAIVIPGNTFISKQLYFYGNNEILIPSYPSLEEAMQEQPCNVLVNFASSRSAYKVCMDGLHMPSLETIIVIAEGVSEREARMLKACAIQSGKIIIGPATVGGLIAGVLKIGNAGGTIDNIIENRLDIRGSVGIATKSGGMLNELMTMVNRNTDGVCEAIAIGGDRFPATTLAEELLILEKNPDIKLLLLLGEVGGTQEYDVVELIKEKRITKPIIAWLSGAGAKMFTESIQFGHAGAMANSPKEGANEKIQALQSVGAFIPTSFNDLEPLLKKIAKQIGIYDPPVNKKNLQELQIQDFENLRKTNQIRYERHIYTSIGRKVGNDETYAGHDIGKTAEERTIGYILGLLWFKKEFPQEICDLFELFIKLTADHGPAVAGAHNTIVTARAGKDLVASLIAGLLTIGPRFGGAVNDAAKYFIYGYDNGMSPFNFVAYMKDQNIPIPGIGHRIKSRSNQDKRVISIREKVFSHVKEHPYFDYALAIETVTTRKKDNLILNVDGAIAAALLDILHMYMTPDEIRELISYEALNAFFVLGRSVGLIGHYIDQKRLHQPLYRHPEWDILEVEAS